MRKMTLLIIPVLIIMLSVNALALTSSIGVFEFVDEDKVVTFDENSTLTEEQQQMVAERLVCGAPEDDGTATYAWCWLIGHNYEYNTVFVVTHKKSPDSPRCYRETYDVETCTRCDHMSEEWIGGVYIICCPEE